MSLLMGDVGVLMEHYWPPRATLLTLISLQLELGKLLDREVDLGTDLREPVRGRVQTELVRLV